MRGGEADFAVPAELIGNPARSAILLALLDGRALPMSVLAGEAGVAASTASAHLSRLVDGGLLRVRQQGRHRYFELASHQVSEALEALARLAPPQPVRSLRSGTRAQALRIARSCYDHIAGHLGVAIMGALVARNALRGGDGRHQPDQAQSDRLSAPGRDLNYQLTDTGWELFNDLGVVIPQGRRKQVAYCVDWTEQRHHLGGAAGAALLNRFEHLDWIRRGAKGVPRALNITKGGHQGLAQHFGINTERLAIIAD